MRLLSVLLTLALVAADTIIVRHDVNDQKYLDFAKSLPITQALVRFSTTDMAGTLISPEWVLSAAHVAQEIGPGERLLAANGDYLEVADVILHPGWAESGFPEDIALLRLATPHYAPVFAQLYEERDEEGMSVILIGNGDLGTGKTGPVRNDGKFRAATNRVDVAMPEFLTWDFDAPNAKHARAEPLEGISGPGDSAGPALIQEGSKYWILGVSSGQDTEATGGVEGVYGVTEYYTRVSTYVDWIRGVIGE